MDMAITLTDSNLIHAHYPAGFPLLIGMVALIQTEMVIVIQTSYGLLTH